MALNKKPVTGMRDILPEEMEIRDYLISVIKDTYRSFGFTSIETPCVESIGNLCSRQGGENEKLIFRILKRGEKLRLAEATEAEDLTDCGLRYDLTVPLARFYANHASELALPFRALQIGNVWRADRPQKGRYRQFVQCDIDILGEPGNLAEIELILAAAAALGKLGFSDFTVRVNDRRILLAMAAYCGFAEEECERVFICWDKMDKIGLNGVKEELERGGFPTEAIERNAALFLRLSLDTEPLAALTGLTEDTGMREAADSLTRIMDCVAETTDVSFRIRFDPMLVRGMSYYTGTIFEIEMADFGGSVAGGGRYDQMIGRFLGRDMPACGLSIGFERIVSILLERGFHVPGTRGKCAYLIEKGLPDETLRQAMRQASQERAAGKQVLFSHMNKNKKFQKEQLKSQGYGEFREFYREVRRD